MVDVGADGWPIGEKRYNCANCSKTRGKDCKRVKRVGIGFCRDHSALNGNKAISEEKTQ